MGPASGCTATQRRWTQVLRKPPRHPPAAPSAALGEDRGPAWVQAQAEPLPSDQVLVVLGPGAAALSLLTRCIYGDVFMGSWPRPLHPWAPEGCPPLPAPGNPAAGLWGPVGSLGGGLRYL